MDPPPTQQGGIDPRVDRLFRVSDPPFLQLRGSGAFAFILVGSLLIAGWQTLLIDRVIVLDHTHKIGYRHGIDRDSYKWEGIGFRWVPSMKYFYFLYYTDLYPISTQRAPQRLEYSASGAWDLLKNDGPKLQMEEGDLLTTGDLGKIFLLYPSAWWNGTPQYASLLEFNRVLGVTSLLALFISFSLLDHRMLAMFLVAVLGSNPFQIFELYTRNNVFGHAVPIAVWMLALHAPLVLGRTGGRLVYLLPVASGALLASVRETRTESALVILAVAGTYLLVRGGWLRRCVLVGTLALSFTATASLWQGYWTQKFAEAHRVVARSGGRTFDADRNSHHAFWHAVWCGLGDFGRDRGYRWHDRTAYRYGIAEVNRRFGTKYRVSPTSFFLENAGRRIKPETLEEYSIVLREKVLEDIRSDPGWYESVLERRVIRVLTDTTPVRLAANTYTVDIPFSGWLFLPAMAWVLAIRRWDQAKLLAFFLPMSLTPILIYSGHGLTYQSVYHLIVAAVLACWCVHALVQAADFARRPSTTASNEECRPDFR